MARPLLSRETLIRILTAIQNLARNWNRDILTFSAFLDDEELGAHIMREFTKLSGSDRIAALSSAKRIVEA
jgi:hypothetical protein